MKEIVNPKLEHDVQALCRAASYLLNYCLTHGITVRDTRTDYLQNLAIATDNTEPWFEPWVSDAAIVAFVLHFAFGALFI